MSSHASHDNLRNEIILVVGSSGLARVWPYEVGLFRSYQTHEPLHIGQSGVSDIVGILLNGKFLGIEVKTGVGKLRQTQKNFKQMILKFNGVFIEGRSSDQVMQEIRSSL